MVQPRMLAHVGRLIDALALFAVQRPQDRGVMMVAGYPWYVEADIAHQYVMTHATNPLLSVQTI